MKRGAFAMFDALGFRTIWQRPQTQVDKVLARLESLRHSIETTSKDAIADIVPSFRQRHGVTPTANISVLSDTVAIGVRFESGAGAEMQHAMEAAQPPPASEAPEAEPSEPQDPPVPATPARVLDGLAVMIASSLASFVLREALDDVPRFAYRGCVALGDFEMADRFMVGPAVQAAADAMNEAGGAFVWLLPTANAAVDAATRAGFPLRTKELWEKAIPFKGGGELHTRLVTPFGTLDEKERKRVFDALMTTFAANNGKDRSDRLDVAFKRRATWVVYDGILRSMALRERLAAERKGRERLVEPSAPK